MTFIENLFVLLAYVIPCLIALAILGPFADHVIQPWLERRAAKRYGGKQ